MILSAVFVATCLRPLLCRSVLFVHRVVPSTHTFFVLRSPFLSAMGHSSRAFVVLETFSFLVALILIFLLVLDLLELLHLVFVEAL